MEPLNEEYVYSLPCLDLKLWPLIESQLSFPIIDLNFLTSTINMFTSTIFPNIALNVKPGKNGVIFESLDSAISELGSQFKDFNFFGKILPEMQRICLEMPLIFKESGLKIPLLRQKTNNELRFTGKQVLCMLCHAFFNTLKGYPAQNPSHDMKKSRFGDITFYRLYSSNMPEAKERLKCLLFYFYTVFRDEKKFEDEEVIFLRRTCDTFPDWESDETPIGETVMQISDTMKIEDSKALMHVDFANKNLQIHNNIPSCTQEEVLFSIRPALFLTLLFTETLKKREVVFMLGCRRYCSYSGYSYTFKFQEGYESIDDPTQISGIIAIDSVVNFGDTQFTIGNIERDINKAYLGFSAIQKELNEYLSKHKTTLDIDRISTGNWGCGAFGGDFQLKFIQQLIAACKVGKKLDYSTFGNVQQKNSLQEVNALIQTNGLKIKDLYLMMVEFRENEKHSQFRDYLNDYLKKKNE